MFLRAEACLGRATPAQVHFTCRFLSCSTLDFEQFSTFSSHSLSPGGCDLQRNSLSLYSVHAVTSGKATVVPRRNGELGCIFFFPKCIIWSSVLQRFLQFGFCKTAGPGQPVATWKWFLGTCRVASVLKHVTFSSFFFIGGLSKHLAPKHCRSVFWFCLVLNTVFGIYWSDDIHTLLLLWGWDFFW